MTESKVLSELKQFREFKKNYKFEQFPLEEINGELFCDARPIYNADGELIGECDRWINVAIKIKSPLSRILSNLFPYTFEFRGFQLQSIEGFFQGVKFKNPGTQRYVFAYSGINAYFMKGASDYRWQDEGNIYWQGIPIKRDSVEYEEIIDELYISAAQNPLFRQALKNANRPLIHSIGQTDKNITLFTRYEYEHEINCLSAFLKTVDK